MGEGESLNEMVRSAGGYARPGDRHHRGQRHDDGRRARGRLFHRPQLAAHRTFRPARQRGVRLRGRRKIRRGRSRLAGRPDRRAVDDDARSHARAAAGRPAARHAAADHPRPGRPQVVAHRHPARDRRARRGAGHHRGDPAGRSLCRGGARRRGAAAGDGGARAARRGGAQRLESRRDHEFHRRGLQRGARQPVVPDHRPRQRRRSAQAAGQAAIRQRGAGSDAGLSPAGRQAADQGLDAARAQRRPQQCRCAALPSTG